MKFLLLFAVNIFLFACTSHAWTFVWHDTDNDAHVELGTRSTDCSKIDMSKGKQYKWDPEDSEYCIHLFTDDKCKTRNGWSCLIWGPRNLGQPWVRSYLVNKEDGIGDDETTTTTSTTMKKPTATGSQSSKSESTNSASRGTTTTVTSTTLSKEASSTPQTSATAGPSQTTPAAAETAAPPPPSEGGSSLSGGEIAGVVIGTCAGVGIIAAFGLLAYRRRRSKNSSSPPNNNDRSPEYGGGVPPAPKPSYPTELDSKPTSPANYPPPPFSSEKEAVGYAKHPVELPDTSPMAEMPGSPGRPYWQR
ncbi:hypothetical protein AJ80_05672 [Polytolypa hystricis UAMH7299]|uniref:Mid2 domain-containing protein n=1 Tax=Polytolypa hystricis (strain UAMH7299) TaxID=1447883 RepID=A0A2B7Y2Y0_POLH7|nr:hypothetical protein AJ80_05672 [Polytolypa hystricis UAMH7299]